MFNQQFTLARYARQYLAPFLRQPRLVALLTALLAPAQQRRDTLAQTTYPAQERAARANAQVVRFERLLQVAFAEPRIYIGADGLGQRTYLYNQDELQPLYTYNEAEADDDPTLQAYLYDEAEYFPAYDFTVNVTPALYASSLPRLRAMINKYKLAGTTYRIRAIS